MVLLLQIDAFAELDGKTMTRLKPEVIIVEANGRPVRTTCGILLPDFLKANGLDPDLVVVERNGHALTKAEGASTELCSGDSLEIVRIVAGG